jgi:hypothetical protein
MWSFPECAGQIAAGLARRRTHFSQTRTRTRHGWREKATLCVIGATVLGGAFPLDLHAEGPTAAVRASGSQRQRAAEGWLRLESRQRATRELSAPLSPSESRRLQVIEQQERARYRERLQTEERELRILDRQERRSDGGAARGPSPEARLQGRLLEQQRARDALELRRRLDRRIHGSPRGRSPFP